MTCDKITYIAYQEAINAAHGISKDSRRDSMKAYKCNDCGKYHLHSSISKINKKKKRMWDVQTVPIHPAKTKGGKRIEPKTGRTYKPHEQPVYATEKMLTKEQAEFLKRLVEGSSQIEKQRS